MIAQTGDVDPFWWDAPLVKVIIDPRPNGSEPGRDTVKRSNLALSVVGVIVATAMPLAGVAGAIEPADPANLTVVPGGAPKKATASWDDWATVEPTATFDAYLVTADDDSTNGAFAADRSRYIDDDATRSVTFDDLSAGTTYYFRVYAVDYTDAGVLIVPPSAGSAGDPIGAEAAPGSTLTINTSADVVASGKPLTLFGSLTIDNVADLPEPITVQSDAFPYDVWVDAAASADGTGKWSKSFAPAINTRYRALYAPATGIGGWTRNVTVEVRKKITVATDPGNTVSAGTTIKYTGTLGGTPEYFQTPIADETVKACLQRLSGSWKTIKCVPVNANATFLIKHEPGVDQDGKYRIYSGMGPAYADSWSRARSITVN